MCPFCTGWFAPHAFTFHCTASNVFPCIYLFFILYISIYYIFNPWNVNFTWGNPAKKQIYPCKSKRRNYSRKQLMIVLLFNLPMYVVYTRISKVAYQLWYQKWSKRNIFHYEPICLFLLKDESCFMQQCALLS